MKRLRRGPQEGPDPNPVLPTARELLGFMSPAFCGLIGYGIGLHWGGFMSAFICAMIGVGLGSRITRAWAPDFYL